MGPQPKVEPWHLITRALGVFNFVGTCMVAIVGWFLIRTIDQFDKHLDRLDVKWESQDTKNISFEHRITLVQGQCCKRSINQSSADEGTI